MKDETNYLEDVLDVIDHIRQYLRACSRSFFQRLCDHILSEKAEGRRSIAEAMLRRSEGFAAKIGHKGVGRKILNRLLRE